MLTSPGDGGVRRPLRGQDPLGQSLSALRRERVAEGGRGLDVFALSVVGEKVLQFLDGQGDVCAVRDDDVAQVNTLGRKGRARSKSRIEIGCRFPLDKEVGDSLSSC